MLIVPDIRKEKAEIPEVLGILLPFAVIEGNILQKLL
jgi:hypothetical protein